MRHVSYANINLKLVRISCIALQEKKLHMETLFFDVLGFDNLLLSQIIRLPKQTGTKQDMYDLSLS